MFTQEEVRDDREVVERTVELAARTKGFGARALRAALDSSPLWGQAGQRTRLT